MTEWRHIDLKDDIGVSVSKSGELYFEIDVDGWNDEDFMDLESLASITGNRSNVKEQTFVVSYVSEEYRRHPEVTDLVNKGIERLKKEMKDFFS